jgi:hypothetical protein
MEAGKVMMPYRCIAMRSSHCFFSLVLDSDLVVVPDRMIPLPPLGFCHGPSAPQAFPSSILFLLTRVHPSRNAIVAIERLAAIRLCCQCQRAKKGNVEQQRDIRRRPV